MKSIVILLSLVLVGCSTPVPLKPKFPEAPQILLEPCRSLKSLEQNAKLSDVAKTVTENYHLYHDCSLKSSMWQEWYKTQRKLFEDVK
jgi:hypothetical protein